MKRIAIYARVSTNEQTVQNQLMQLRDWAAARDYKIVQEFIDEGISGAKDRRPALLKMLEACHRGEVDIVAASALDRLGRSLKHLVMMLEELEAMNIGVYLGRECIDTTTPMGKLMIHMAAAFAEFERSLIAERSKLGQERARRNGKHIGRPKVPQYVERKIEKLIMSGCGQDRAARICNVGKSVVGRIAREIKQSGAPTSTAA